MDWMGSTEKEVGIDYIVIDVRTEDFIGGNIRDAINIPHDEFVSNIPNIINNYYKTKNIIFHCMYSMHRGPECCDWYINAINALLNNDKLLIGRLCSNEHEDFAALIDMKLDNEKREYLKQQNIHLLFQGFSNFLHKNKTNSPLIDNFDQDHWTDDLQHKSEVL